MNSYHIHLSIHLIKLIQISLNKTVQTLYTLIENCTLFDLETEGT